MQGPDELLVRKSSERRSRESSTGDNFVSHHLQTVEDGDGVGGELHPPVLLIPHVRGGGTFLPQDPELSERKAVHQTAARHVGLSDEEVGHYSESGRSGVMPGQNNHHYWGDGGRTCRLHRANLLDGRNRPQISSSRQTIRQDGSGEISQLTGRNFV